MAASQAAVSGAAAETHSRNSLSFQLSEFRQAKPAEVEGYCYLSWPLLPAITHPTIKDYLTEMEGSMAEPALNEELLRSVGSAVPASKPGPVPVTGAPADVAGLLPEQATDKPLGEWPPGIKAEGRLADTGDAVGTVLGVAVHTVRQIPEFMQDRAAYLRRRFRIIRGRVKSGQLQDEMKDRASEVTDEASRQVRDLRNRAESYARNNPLHFIAGAAAAGFVIGFLLRMWRDE